jgi:NADH-quinone oxidoreductase subunit N
MTLFLFSLTGLPPTVGFIGKFYLFSAVIEAKLYLLAVVGVLNSVVSLYYYARVVKYMFFDDPPDDQPLASQGWSFSGVLVGLALATLVFGIYWRSLASITASSANLLL